MDSYYLPSLPEECRSNSGNLNFDHPLAFDWELLTDHLQKLKSGLPIQVPHYDFKSSTRLETSTRLQAPYDLVLFEGIFALFNQDIRELMDLKCYMHVDADIRFTRRLHRDVSERGRTLQGVIDQYYDTVRPMHQKYLEPQKQFADIIVGENTDVAIDLMKNKMNHYLGSADRIGPSPESVQ